MKDKEKQINENSNYMFFSKRQKLAEEYEQWVNTPLKDGSKIKDCALSVITFMQIKGFQKLPENSVVLSREEYDKLKYAWITDSDAYKKGSNETAEKFLQLAYDRCLEKSFIKKVEELAQQFGVKIKE